MTIHQSALHILPKATEKIVESCMLLVYVAGEVSAVGNWDLCITSACFSDRRKTFSQRRDIRGTSLHLYMFVYLRVMRILVHVSNMHLHLHWNELQTSSSKMHKPANFQTVTICLEHTIFEMQQHCSVVNETGSYSPPCVSTTNFISFCVSKWIKLRSYLAKPPSGSLRLMREGWRFVVSDG